LARAKVVVLAVLLGLPATATADPGTGILVLRDGSAVFGDPERNIIWKIDLSGRVSVLVRDRHSHLLRLERDGAIIGEHLEYVSASSQWRSSFWRLAPGARVPIDIQGPVTASEPFPDGMSLRLDSQARAYSWSWLDGAHSAQQLVRRHTSAGRREVLTARGWQPFPAARIAPRRFNQITGIAFGPSTIAVAELTQVSAIDEMGLVDVLGRSSAFPRNRGAPEPEAYLKRLWGVVVDSAGASYVADGGGRQIVRLVPGQPPVAVFQLRDQYFPVGVALGARSLYVLEYPDPGSRAATGPRVRVITLDNAQGSRVLGATPAER
jgi:hypothetical protein